MYQRPRKGLSPKVLHTTLPNIYNYTSIHPIIKFTSIQLSIHSLTLHALIHMYLPYMHLYMYFIPYNYSSIHPVIYVSIYSSTQSSVYQYSEYTYNTRIYLSNYLYIYWSSHLSNHLFIHPFIYLFIYNVASIHNFILIMQYWWIDVHQRRSDYYTVSTCVS